MVIADAKQLMHNKIYPLITGKQKKLDPNERSIFQLCKLYAEIFEKEPKSYCSTKKSHATLISKKFIPLYLKHLKFLISLC